MSSKLLNAAHRLLEDPSEEGNHITVGDRACYTWLRDTPLKALHPRRHVFYLLCSPFLLCAMPATLRVVFLTAATLSAWVGPIP